MPPVDIIPKPPLPWQLSDPVRARAKLAAYLAEADANAARLQEEEAEAAYNGSLYAPTPLGLSTAHIPPLPTLALYHGGNLAQLSFPGEALVQPKKRGKITGFSPASRIRLLRKIAMLNKEALPPQPKFITLTYPGDYWHEPAVVKADLDAFRKRLERKFGKCLVIWREELQARGAPHFHLLVFCEKYIPYRWVAISWNNIVAPTDVDHLKAGTSIERVRSWNGVTYYVAKYMSKPQDKHDGYKPAMGRLWGIWNLVEGEHIIREETALEPEEFYRVRRILAQYFEHKTGRKANRKYPDWGLHIFMPYAQADRIIDWLEIRVAEYPP